MALHHYVIIDGERYFLPDESSMSAVREEALRAVHSGGAYLALGRPGGGYIEVMVTAMTPVRFEYVLVESEPADKGRPTPPDVDSECGRDGARLPEPAHSRVR